MDIAFRYKYENVNILFKYLIYVFVDVSFEDAYLFKEFNDK